MSRLLKRAAWGARRSSRVIAVVVVFAFLLLSALFAARAPAVRITQALTAKSSAVSSTRNFAACAALSWTQLSPTGTGPDVNSQQFVSDGKGNLIMFGGCGPTACNASN